MTQTEFTPGVKSAKKLLRFQLIAARKQRDYEEKRRAYTDLCLKDFKLRQEAIKTMVERDPRADVVYLLEVMQQVLESIDDDNDPASASLMLRTCLKEYAEINGRISPG